MEEQTLHYYLKVFSILFFFILILLLSYIFYVLNKKITLQQNLLNIQKGEKLEKILSYNIVDLSELEINIIKIYYYYNKFIYKKFIHFGDFNVEKISSIKDLLDIIYNPSNVLNKITIVEGWSINQFDNELSKHFSNYSSIPYEKILADTYFYQKNNNFDLFYKNLLKTKKEYFLKKKNNKLLDQYTDEEIMIIGSIIEKEGLDKLDKKNISSVIFNRLDMNMKLQIDATVLFAVTNGNYDLDRKLLLSDLKINHPYNTYVISGLPPKPISYVGKKTLDIIFENYTSDFLFYFFNKSLKRHIFSKSFKEHKRKLNEYRKTK